MFGELFSDVAQAKARGVETMHIKKIPVYRVGIATKDNIKDIVAILRNPPVIVSGKPLDGQRGE